MGRLDLYLAERAAIHPPEIFSIGLFSLGAFADEYRTTADLLWIKNLSLVDERNQRRQVNRRSDFLEFAPSLT
jgi:hypothetical protein